MKIRISYLLFILILTGLLKLMLVVGELESRVEVLEKEAKTTVEIQVERAYDKDMGAYGYTLIGVKGEKGK